MSDDNQGQELVAFDDEGGEHPSDRKESAQLKNSAEDQVRQYDNEYNQQPDQAINELQPVEVDQQPIIAAQEGEESLLKRIKTCKCRRGQEEKTEDDVNQEGCVSKLDKLIQKYLTPFYLLFVYYAVFFTLILYCLKLVILDGDWVTFEVLVGIFAFTQLSKALLIYFLSDEWWDELPYLDSGYENGFRATGITVAVLCNLDICFWVYQIYKEQKRDATIEHMMAMCRMIDAFFLNIPLMVGFLYFQMQNLEELNIPYLIISGINLFAMVNGFMHLNFFAGSSFLSIRWSIQYICELYVKVLLSVSVFCQLSEFEVEYAYFGLFGVFGFLQFYLFSDESDWDAKLLSILYFQFRTFLVINFKEVSFGMSELDCDAQPSILNVNLARDLFTYIQKAFNYFQLISLGFIFWLFGGWQVILENEIMKMMYIVALPCFGIQFLNLIYVLLYGWSKSMLKAKQ